MKNFRKALKMEQENQRNLMRNTHGITLIALVITVIVMLILAGVAISVLTDDGGLFEKTRGAAEAYENSAEKEAKQIDDLMNDIDQYIAGLPVSKPITSTELAEKTSGNWDGKVNTPKLATGMTAVYWKANGQEVELTSSSSKSEWNKWYSYTAQTGSTATAGSGTSKWANAVTKDENGNITGYWVWIPRYEYKLTAPASGAKAGTIDVNFIPTSKPTASSGYKIPPVFTSDTNKGGWDSELPGFWVAKYPAGYQKSTVNTSGVVQNGSDTVVYSSLKYTNPGNSYTNVLGQNLSTTNNAYASQNISYPVFKPLTYTYNCINIDSMYRISQDIKNKYEFYRLSNTTDSHLMKNSEWGAVAYLAWSQYGRNATEPNINNVNLNNKDSKNIYAVTGMTAAGTDTAHTNGSFVGNAYNTPTGQLGSTTGNITGVYDMSGCVWEYVAGYINNTSGASERNTCGASLMSATAKYSTVYPHNSSSDSAVNNWAATNVATRYGDAVKETSTTDSTGWNGDASIFPYSSYPFFQRGGNYSSTAFAGLFAFDYINGRANNSYGFRVCLVPGPGGTL